VVTGAALIAASGAVSASEVTLRIGHVTTINAPAGKGSTAFAETAKELSNGEITVEIYPNAQLGGELEMLSQIRLGTLDLAMLGSGIVASVEPAFSLTELPYIWNDGDSAWKALSGDFGRQMLDMLEPKGMQGLSFGFWDARGLLLTGNSPVNTVEDLKGRKIRIIENPIYVRTMRAYGVNAVPMAWPEVYSGLQQGTIDGVETNYHGMADAKLYEVSTDLAVVDHIFTATVYVMNKRRFDALSSEHQEIIMQAAKAAGDTMYGASRQANEDAIATMEASGVNVTRPDLAPFREATQDVRDYFTTIVGPDLMAAAEAAQN
jgi:tripartite ATP-independent transporter DctP family solute receptor